MWIVNILGDNIIIMKSIILLILPSLFIYSTEQSEKGKAELPSGFSYINEVDPTIIIRSNYARESNFRGKVVQGYLRNTAIISTAAAYALKNVQSVLRDIGYGLVVYDAYRPQKAVDDMVAWTKQPQNYKTKEQFYPYLDKNKIIPDYLATKSGHSRGSTVDLTIIRLDKQIHNQILIDYILRDGRKLKIRDDGTQFMCGHFDLFDQVSHHDSMLISSECLQKRNLLRDVMAKHNFLHLQEQWWHYRLYNEPFPSTYFDFNVQ